MEMVVIQKSELIDLIRQELSSVRMPVIPDKKESDLTDVDGIAELTGWAVQTIYTKHSKGEFPPGCVFKQGKKLFFSRKAILNWIQSGN